MAGRQASKLGARRSAILVAIVSFSAPIAMLLYIVWPIVAHRPGLVVATYDFVVIGVATALISTSLALYAFRVR